MYDHPKTKRKVYKGIALAACTFELSDTVPTEIQLTPAGRFRARDGRPEGLSGWYIDAAIAARVIAVAQQSAGDFVIDYEHQTLNAESNGHDAPARGWWQGANMEWREGKGLFATNIDWTNTARAQIEAKEYRYISPVFHYEKTTGNITSVVMAALTNYPAVDGLSDLTALAATRFNTHLQEDNTVDRKQLIALLGLTDDVSDEQINQAVTALKTKAQSHTAVARALGVTDDTDPIAAIAALKTASSNDPDPAKFVPVGVVADLQTQVATLTTQINTDAVNDLVEIALGDGRLLPAQEDWARRLGKSDVAELKAFLASAQPVAALKGKQTKGDPKDANDNTELSDEALAVCKQMGIDPKEYKKTIAAE